MADAVEKVGGTKAARNNRILGVDFPNRSCGFETGFESILLCNPLKIFSTAESGHKRTRALHKPMSALPPKADICAAQAHVRFGPEADSCSAAKRIAIR
jgi:hypothetical protein